MSVSYGPKLGLLINALTGDSHDVALRALLRAIDQEQFLSIKNRTTTAPPGSPANGDAYIVATGGSGAWSGHDKHLAVWTTDNPVTPSGLWEFYVPKAGWLAYSVADAAFYSYSGSAWGAFGGGSTSFIGLSDVPGSFSGAAGKVVKVNGGATALEFVPGGGGVTNFPDLGDVPPSYTGEAGKVVAVKGTEDGLEFIPAGGGGGVPSGAGVPTGSGALGDLKTTTDGGIGDTLYAYVGSKVGLPIIRNRGGANAFGSGISPVITMQRNMTLGNLLVAVSFCDSGGVTQTLNTGWTSIFIDGGPTPALAAAYKVADVVEDGLSTVQPWASQTDAAGLCLFVVEISNFDTVTPIAQSIHGGTSSPLVSGLSANQLILAFLCSGAISNGSGTNLELLKRAGSIPLGMQISTGGSGAIEAIGTAIPFIPEVVGPGTITKYGFVTIGQIAASCVIVIGTGAGTVNYWNPIG